MISAAGNLDLAPLRLSGNVGLGERAILVRRGQHYLEGGGPIDVAVFNTQDDTHSSACDLLNELIAGS